MKRLRIALLIISVLVVIFLGGGAAAYYGMTIIPLWVPLMWAAGAGVVFAPLLSRPVERLTGIRRRWVNLIVSGVCAAIVTAFLFLGSNRWLADDSRSHTEQVTVTGKYTEERTRYRRVGRGRMVPAGKYNEYFVTVAFQSGATKRLTVTPSRYVSTRTGSRIDFTLTRGAWGYPVITSRGRL